VALAPRPKPNPSMLSIFGWMINPVSCLGGQGSLPNLIVLDNNLDSALLSLSLVLSSFYAIESLLNCSLLRYCPKDNKDHKDDNYGKAEASWGLGTSDPGHLAHVLALPHTPSPHHFCDWLCCMRMLPTMTTTSHTTDAPHCDGSGVASVLPT
jgi:hypothetical protein